MEIFFDNENQYKNLLNIVSVTIKNYLIKNFHVDFFFSKDLNSYKLLLIDPENKRTIYSHINFIILNLFCIFGNEILVNNYRRL